jgi:hypothetical protein
MRFALLAPVLALLVAAPVALAVTADPFGPVEVVDAGGRPGDLIFDGPLIGVDGAGNALWAGYARDAESGDDQMAVFERCGTTWNRTLLGAPQENWIGVGLRVAPDGTAMAVWRGDAATGTSTYSSSVRLPGEAWGAPQTIVAEDGLSGLQFELADNGTAVAVWADGDGTHASFRPAGGAWGAAETVVSTALRHDVALSPTGDAVLLYQGSTPGYAYSKYRPAGGTWGGAVEVLANNYQNTMQSLRVEFDGAGRTVAFADFREFTDTIRVNVGAGGGWGPTDQVLDDDGANPPNPLFDLRNPVALVRHPQGAVAVWTRRSTSSNFNDDVVVARLIGGTWETPKVFDAPDRYSSASVATNAAGEILLAAGLNPGTGGGVDDIHVATAPSIDGAWSAMTRISPAGTAATGYRTAVAGGGGPAFYVAWGVHGSGDRTEIVTTKAGTCGPPSPTPTVTPTPTPAADPLPLPPATPTATPPPIARPRAIADFTTLPAASRCVRGRKLTLRFKRPPKGYAVKAVKVRVNARKVATLKGSRLKRPYYLRKLPRGTFTVTVSITLKQGKGLTERRRYRACK